MANEFTVGSAVSFGWDKMKLNFTLFLGIIFTAIGIEVVGNWLGRINGIGAVFLLATVVAVMLIKIGVYGVTLDIVDAKPVNYKDIFSKSSLLWDYILGTLLYVLIVIGGLILLIVPGIIWAIKYQFYGYIIVDRKMNAFDAIKESGRITDGHKWTLLGLCIMQIGIVLLGFICLIVGVLAAIPVVEMSMAFAYRTLSDLSKPRSAPTPVPETPAPVAAEPAVVAPAAKKAPAKKAPAKKKIASKKKR